MRPGDKLELTESRLGPEIRDDAIEGAPRRGGINVGRSLRLKSGSSCDCLPRLFIMEVVPVRLDRELACCELERQNEGTE